MDRDSLIVEGGGEIERLLEIMRRLRDPQGGCPWDLKQTFQSIAPYTIEEAYEVADAIEQGDMNELRDELGDLLLQVVYHAQIATEQAAFTFEDVTLSISDKMLRRHPHVFGDAASADWEAIKEQERAAKGAPADQSALAGVPTALPALTRAEKLQKKAARVGFDWAEIGPVLDKIKEEADEVAEALSSQTADEVEAEIGDLLFAVANLARHAKVDPEAALRRANAKFTRRFKYIEQALKSEGRSAAQASLDEMDAHWNEAKKLEADTI